MEKINWRRISSKVSKLIGAALLMLSLFPCETKAISLINDEETEQYLQSVIKPIFQAANIPFDKNNIYIINDSSLNAFVSDGNRMFINTGTIINVKNTNELTGVLAHETGHIKGGHILRQKLKLQNMQRLSLASLILASAAGIASGRGDVAMGIMLGGNSSALNSLSAHRVEEERSADEAAINLLDKLHQSPEGLLNFMQKVKKQNIMQGQEETPYFRTHPLTSERIGFLQNAVKNSHYGTASAFDNKLKRIQAKLTGFLMKPAYTRNIYPVDSNSPEALYANTIAYLQEFNYEKAGKNISILLEKEPNNPHFMELQGQIYLEKGELSKAKEMFAKALKILPNSALFKYNLAQTALENKINKTELLEIEKMLNSALNDFPIPYGWILLARTYDELGMMAEKQYASAKYSMEIGEILVAKRQISEAKKYKTNARTTLKIDDLEQEINSYLEED